MKIFKQWLVKSDDTTEVPLVESQDIVMKEHKPHRKVILTGVLFGLFLIILAGYAFLATAYGEKAVPGTHLANHDISGKAKHEIKDEAKYLLGKIELSIAHKDKTVVAKSEDMGIVLDTDATVDQAVQVGMDRNIISRFNPFSRKEAPLVVSYDFIKFQNFLNEQFSEYVNPPKEPTIVYNEQSELFDVTEGSSGQILNAKSLQGKLDELIHEPHSDSVTVELSAGDPLVPLSAATEAQEYMNKRVVLAINLNYNGQLLYFVDPWDIAAWADIVPNPKTSEIEIEFDKAKILQFLTNTVAPNLAAAPVDEKILINKEGQELMVVQHGQNGRQPRDMSQLVDQVYNAAVNATNIEQELDLVEANFKTVRVTVDDTNWIEVNLSNQTAMLWNGTQLLRTFIVSTGVANWPTVTGEFRVWYKTPSQTMTGGSRADGSYYNLDNVQWVSYFYQDYALHGKWWNNIYGSPSSHGCVGMTNADAKIVYDFAPVGTRVVVHY